MRLATSTNIVVNRPGGVKTPVSQAIALCAEAGYRLLDINFCDAVAFGEAFASDGWQQWVRHVRDTAKACGVTLIQAHSSFYNVCDARAVNREVGDELIRRCVLACAELGIPWLVMHAGTDPEDYARSLDANTAYFEPVIALAARHGVGIAFENLWELDISPRKRFTTRIEELMALVERFDPAHVGVCWDEEHSMITGDDARATLARIGGRLRTLHVSDYLDVRINHILPFAGKTDWQALMAALKQSGYAGDFTYELHNYASRYPDALLPEALRHSIAVGEYLLSL